VLPAPLLAPLLVVTAEGRSLLHEVTMLIGLMVRAWPPRCLPKPALSEADLARFAHADGGAGAWAPADLKSPSTVGHEPPSVPAPSVDSLPSDKDAKVSGLRQP